MRTGWYLSHGGHLVGYRFESEAHMRKWMTQGVVAYRASEYEEKDISCNCPNCCLRRHPKAFGPALRAVQGQGS